MDTLTITAEVQTAIARHARQQYPRECCGILLGTRALVTLAIGTANVAEKERLHDRFMIDPLEILRADKQARAEGLEIVGFFHSHPNHEAVPSATDVSLAWAEYVYLIIQVNAESMGEMRAWRFDAGLDMTKREIKIVIKD